MTKISKTKVGFYAKLRHKKYRQESGLFLAQGYKCVADTISEFQAEVFILKEGSGWPEFIPRDGSMPVVGASESELRKISTLENVPDVIAVYRMPRHPESAVTAGTNYLALDGVQDPGNLGTIIRTAHWFGIDTIFCSKDTVDVYNPKTVLSTMGSLGKVKVIYTDLEALFAGHPNIPVYGLMLRGNNIFREKEFAPGFILMGSEGHGISPELAGAITRLLTIPPANAANHPESLNVAIATAVTLTVMKQYL